MSPVVVYPLSCSVLQAGFVFGSSDRRCGLLAVRAHATLAVTNPSFEGSTGWTGLTTGSEEFWAAPFHLAGAPATTQTTEIIEASKTYTFEAYARSIHPEYISLLPGGLTSATYTPRTRASRRSCSSSAAASWWLRLARSCPHHS